MWKTVVGGKEVCASTEVHDIVDIVDIVDNSRRGKEVCKGTEVHNIVASDLGVGSCLINEKKTNTCTTLWLIYLGEGSCLTPGAKSR